MTELLERALAVVRQMPPAEQDNIAQAIFSLAHLGEPLDIEPEHRDAVMEGMAQVGRGEFAEGTAYEMIARAFKRACVET